MQRIKTIFPFTFVLIFPIFINAQARHTISGTVIDKRSGETLIGASVVLPELPHAAVLSNSYGFYSINAVAGKYKLVVSFTGYLNDTLLIPLDRDTVVRVALVVE